MKMILAAGCLIFVGTGASQAALVINSLNTAVTENFNTLASIGTSSTVPTGWALAESGANANADYTAGTGSGNAGETYSFGASGSSERAFGGLQSGNLIPTIGVKIENNSGFQISEFSISYFGEQWRVGALNRQDRLDFQYSTDATSLTLGTWVDFNTLDFTAPITTGSTGALDGNANRVSIAGNLTGLSLAHGQTIWFRWNDFNATGADDGLAIDDFSVTAVPEPAELGAVSGLGLMAVLGLHVWRERRKSINGISAS